MRFEYNSENLERQVGDSLFSSKMVEIGEYLTEGIACLLVNRLSNLSNWIVQHDRIKNIITFGNPENPSQWYLDQWFAPLPGDKIYYVVTTRAPSELYDVVSTLNPDSQDRIWSYYLHGEAPKGSELLIETLIERLQ